MILIKDLEKLNLSEKEARLYTALLQLGEVNLQRIVQKTGLKRTTTYEIIETLRKKDLVHTTKRKKRTFYYAANPKKIGNLLDEKKELFKKILPELLSITNSIDKKPSIQFFEGMSGIKNIYQDTLAYNKSVIQAWLSEDAKFFDEKYLLNKYIPHRIKNEIFVQAIAPKTSRAQKLKKNDKKHLRQTKLIDFEDGLFFEVEINLYGGSKIGIMSFQENFGLIIESKKIHNTLKTIFELQWKSTK
jgi:sugar-specific transcriptional regulator TrmB